MQSHPLTNFEIQKHSPSKSKLMVFIQKIVYLK